jgi:hypothetical protein
MRSDIETSATNSRSEQNYFARGKRLPIDVGGTGRKKSDCGINIMDRLDSVALPRAEWN